MTWATAGMAGLSLVGPTAARAAWRSHCLAGRAAVPPARGQAERSCREAADVAPILHPSWPGAAHVARCRRRARGGHLPAARPGTCALTASVVNSWPGGYQLQLTVANNGTAPATDWTAGFSFGGPADTIANSWGATVSQSGATVSATNVSYDGAIAAGGSVTWGMIVNGGNQALSGLSCALS